MTEQQKTATENKPENWPAVKRQEIGMSTYYRIRDPDVMAQIVALSTDFIQCVKSHAVQIGRLTVSLEQRMDGKSYFVRIAYIGKSNLTSEFLSNSVIVTGNLKGESCSITFMPVNPEGRHHIFQYYGWDVVKN